MVIMLKIMATMLILTIKKLSRASFPAQDSHS